MSRSTYAEGPFSDNLYSRRTAYTNRDVFLNDQHLLTECKYHNIQNIPIVKQERNSKFIWTLFPCGEPLVMFLRDNKIDNKTKGEVKELEKEYLSNFYSFDLSGISKECLIVIPKGSEYCIGINDLDSRIKGKVNIDSILQNHKDTWIEEPEEHPEDDIDGSLD